MQKKYPKSYFGKSKKSRESKRSLVREGESFYKIISVTSVDLMHSIRLSDKQKVYINVLNAEISREDTYGFEPHVCPSLCASPS